MSEALAVASRNSVDGRREADTPEASIETRAAQHTQRSETARPQQQNFFFGSPLCVSALSGVYVRVCMYVDVCPRLQSSAFPTWGWWRRAGNGTVALLVE